MLPSHNRAAPLQLPVERILNIQLQIIALAGCDEADGFPGRQPCDKHAWRVEILQVREAPFAFGAIREVAIPVLPRSGPSVLGSRHPERVRRIRGLDDHVAVLRRGRVPFLPFTQAVLVIAAERAEGSDPQGNFVRCLPQPVEDVYGIPPVLHPNLLDKRQATGTILERRDAEFEAE